MSYGRVSVVSLSIALCVALLATALPAAIFAAADSTLREYIVTFDVKDSGRRIKPASRADKDRLRSRSKAARLKTNQITARQGVKARHRYGASVTGFSARMTRAQARRMAADPAVTSVRVARTFRLARQPAQPGIKRVAAFPASPQPDVDANVAIIDSGIGPIAGSELDIAGGVNCYDPPSTDYGDVDGHGTHVAGIIGARDNDIGAVGVAPGANLYAVRVFGSSGGTSEGSVLCGLDWVIDTYSNATPDIDVVNMSLQAWRGPPPYEESCAATTDLVQQLICDLKTMNVPVVVSAGNYASDADSYMPGGYDQVISVGAMTDTDGTGGGTGSRASCNTYSGGRDDAWAGYSNYGPDVDIAAPGTCVWSTWYGDPSGNTLFDLTGTSMAAPHVTGAVARYIDKHGKPDTVGKMRQLIRAAGDMGWDIRSDPTWFGPNDTDPPNRVLDVAALTANNPGLKTFLYHSAFRVGRTDTSRTTRVDIQRIGGHVGPVNLGITPLPAGVGTADFDSAVLDGLNAGQLGTNLNFDLDPSGGDDVYELKVTANSNTATADPRDFRLTIDRTPPTVSGLSPKVRSGAQVSLFGKAQVYVRWKSSDNLTGVKRARLQQKIGTGSWRNVGTARGGGSAAALVKLKRGLNNKFRVKAVDELGNTRWSSAIGGRLSIRDSKSAKLSRTGSWKTRKTNKAYGGSMLVATAGTARMKTTFTSKAVAIMAPRGPGRGKFRVRIDGGNWRDVKVNARSTAQRKVVWSARLTKGTHTLEIQRVWGQPALDGLVFIH